MRILITGAAGFLGSHLCDHLLKDGHEVIGMDNFVTGSPDNIAHLADNDNFSFYRRDVSEYIFVPGKVDAILHFASPASPNPQSKSGYFSDSASESAVAHRADAGKTNLANETRPKNLSTSRRCTSPLWARASAIRVSASEVIFARFGSVNSRHSSATCTNTPRKMRDVYGATYVFFADTRIPARRKSFTTISDAATCSRRDLENHEKSSR